MNDEQREQIALAYRFARTNHRRYNSIEFDDIRQIAWETIAIHWHRYDPSKAAKTTYFFRQIRTALQRYYIGDTGIHIPAYAHDKGFRPIFLPLDTDDVEANPDAYTPTTDDETVTRLSKNEIGTLCTQYLDHILSSFFPREADIFRRRIDGWTLEQISIPYGLSRERIRQIETIVIRKARRVLSVNRITNYDDLARFLHRLKASTVNQMFEWGGHSWIRCEQYALKGRQARL